MRKFVCTLPVVSALFAAAASTVLAGCSGSSSTPPTPVSFTLSASTVTLPQDGTQATVTISATGPSGSETVTLGGLSSGITSQFTPTGGGPSGTLTLTGGSSVAAGTVTGSVTVSIGNQSATQTLTVVSAVVAKVGTSADTSLGVNGELSQYMSTSFQVAEWDGNPFTWGAGVTSNENTLTALGPQHTRMQTVSQGDPMVANTGAASDWDFTILDRTVLPVLASADHSPEFQIGTAPAWMCLTDGTLDVTNHLQDFVAYSANLVRYYNTGGFDWGGTHFVSKSSYPITWWGIFNEPNGNGLTVTQYVTLYDAVVPAMLAVDPNIKFLALEFSDYGLGTGDGGDPETWLPTFLAPAASGGVNTQVNGLATHFYSSCNQTDTDADLMATIPQFVANIDYFYQELATRPDLASLPVMVLENNVNADYEGANGKSTCNPNQVFVTDQRGTSAFFAAWRPYVFSQLGKAANRALYHWSYTGGQQYGEVDNNGNPYLSYWVDHTLTELYPAGATSPGEQILSLASTDTNDVEALAVLNSSGTVTVMVVDRAIQSTTDNNGTGAPRTIIVDLSSFSAFTSASLITLDANTNITTGPTAQSITPAARMTITLSGYGSAFLTLTP